MAPVKETNSLPSPVRRVTDSATEQNTAGHCFVTFTAVLLLWVGLVPSLTIRATSTRPHVCRDSSTGGIELDPEEGLVFV